VVSVTSEQNIVFHDPQSLVPVKQLIGHNDEIIDVKYLHNGTHIVAVTNSAQVYSITQSEPVALLPSHSWRGANVSCACSSSRP
jgi:hypothetical protein